METSGGSGRFYCMAASSISNTSVEWGGMLAPVKDRHTVHVKVASLQLQFYGI